MIIKYSEMRQRIINIWGLHKCIYCDRSDVDLHIEHITPRKRGGTNRLENLGLACQPCNNRKHDKPIAEYLKADPERLRRILDYTTNPDIIKLDLAYRRTTSASTPTMYGHKPRRIRYTIRISPRLEDLLMAIAKHEEVTIQYVIIRLLEDYMPQTRITHPATMAEALDPARIQTRYYDLGNGTHAEIK